MSIWDKKDTGHVQFAASFRIVLEHAGTLLYELNTAEYSKEIIIGRSRDCTWTLDGIDSSASARHAVISRRKNNFYITDLGSRNGIYFQNKRKYSEIPGLPGSIRRRYGCSQQPLRRDRRIGKASSFNGRRNIECKKMRQRKAFHRASAQI